MDTPGLTGPPSLVFHCWTCRAPFPADQLLIFTTALPDELCPPPTEDGRYHATVGLAYLCRECTRQGLALTNDDIQTAFAPLAHGKDTSDEFLSTAPDAAHADPL